MHQLEEKMERKLKAWYSKWRDKALFFAASKVKYVRIKGIIFINVPFFNIRSLLAILFVAFLAVFQISCGGGGSGGGEASHPLPVGNFNSIDGIITLQGASNNSGATVMLEGTSYSTTTDSTGWYRLRDFPNGWYYVIVSKDGYRTKHSGTNWVFSGADHYRYDATLTLPSATQAITIATGLYFPWALTSDGSYLYFSETGRLNMDTLKKVPISGGNITTLIDSLQFSPGSILFNNNWIYWTSSNGGDCINKIPALGGIAPSTVTCGSDLRGNLITDNVYLYSHGTQAFPPTKIWKINISGGSLITIADGLIAPRGISIDGDYIYFTEQGTGNQNGTVKKVPLVGGTIVTLVSGLLQPAAIAVKNGYVYFTDIGASRLAKIPVQGGTPVTLSGNFIMPNNILIDGNYIYVAEYDSDGTVKKISIDGGNPIELDNDGQGAWGMVTDNLYVYWTEPFGGKIKKAPK